MSACWCDTINVYKDTACIHLTFPPKPVEPRMESETREDSIPAFPILYFITCFHIVSNLPAPSPVLGTYIYKQQSRTKIVLKHIGWWIVLHSTTYKLL